MIFKYYMNMSASSATVMYLRKQSIEKYEINALRTSTIIEFGWTTALDITIISYFFILISMYTVYNFIFLGIGLYVMVEIGQNAIFVDTLSIQIFLSIELFIKFIVNVAVVVLLIFHIYLHCK